MEELILKPENPRKRAVRQRDLAYLSGPIIKKYRKQMGYSQIELSRRLEVSRSLVGSWEACMRTPQLHHYLAMAKIFGVTVEDLYMPIQQPINEQLKDNSTNQ